MRKSRNAKPQTVRNSDNEHVLPVDGHVFMTGYSPDINGPGAAEVQSFPATRAELEILAEHYATTAVDHETFMYIHEMSPGSWVRDLSHCYDRLNQIERALGQGIVQTILDREWAKYPDLKGQRARAREEYEKHAAEARDRFYEQVVRYARGEEHDLGPTTIGMAQAEIAKVLIAQDPDLLLPGNKDKLLEAIESAWRRDNTLPVPDQGATHEDDPPRE